MNIPDKIIEGLQHLPFTVRGEVLSGIIAFIGGNPIDENEFSSEALGVYLIAREALEPIMRRRRRDAARRQRRREARLGTAAKPANTSAPTPESSAKEEIHTDLPDAEPRRPLNKIASTPMVQPPMSRRERRALERTQQKQRNRALPAYPMLRRP